MEIVFQKRLGEIPKFGTQSRRREASVKGKSMEFFSGGGIG